ncbi:MAG: hypothetical protein LC114_23245 [Bryobacterales bacterium]|nr:hypothetical protein [Bryobacterales bacterium]
MQNRRQFIVLFATAAGLRAADKNQFKPEALESYSNAQKAGGLTFAADAYHDPERARLAFGSKAKPYEHGVLPVMLIIRNDSKRAVTLEGMRVEYQADRARSAAIPPQEVPYLQPAQRPRLDSGGPIPGRVTVRRQKNPLNAGEIQDRAFAARMLPPGEIAAGFLYFQALYRENAILYITGIKDPASGQDLFFVEVPVNNGPH